LWWLLAEYRFRPARAFGETETDVDRVNDLELILERRPDDKSSPEPVDAVEKLKSRSSGQGSSLLEAG
jgi:hypothetical protein